MLPNPSPNPSPNPNPNPTPTPNPSPNPDPDPDPNPNPNSNPSPNLPQRYLQRYSGFSAHLVGPDLPPQLLNTSRRPGKGEPGSRAAAAGAGAAGAGAAGAAAAGAAGGSAARPRLLRNHTILVSSLHRTPDGGEYLPLALAGSGADLGRLGLGRP